MKKITHLLLSVLFIAGVTGCQKDVDPTLFPPTLATDEANGMTRTEAVMHGKVIPNPQSPQGQEHTIYFMYSSQSPKLLEDVKTIEAIKGTGDQYSANLTKLVAGTTYYYCIAASSGYNIVKGEILRFTTNTTAEPTVTISVNLTTETSISLTGAVTENGGSDIHSKGFVYNLYVEGEKEPTIDNGTNIPGNMGAETEFFATIDKNLQPETTYIVRAYATNGDSKTGYSEAIKVTTNKLLKPTVNTNEPTNLTAYSALLNGTIVSDNGYKVTDCGFCYSSESQAPTLDHPHTSATEIKEKFSAEVKKLETNKTYYFRAYAINEKGTSYGEVLSFTTPEVQKLSVVAPVISNITTDGAQAVASVNVPQGSSLIEKGVCYSTSVMVPTTNETSKADLTPGTGIAISLQDLKEGTLYHICAYAISRDETYYSSPVQFTTVRTMLAEISNPAISDITTTSASLSTRITSDGGATVLTKGFCYSKNTQTPTIDNSLVTDQSEGKTINASLSALEEGVTYYVRAYATNKNGTAYSNMASFKTVEHLKPTVSDLVQIAINDDNATMQAKIAGNGGLPITERGFCWSANASDPTINDSKVTAQTNDDIFRGELTGLQYNTSYYVRAYATNAKGTSYSGFMKIQTGSSEKPTVGSLKVGNTTPSTIEVTASVTADGNATITERGFCYNTTGSPVVDGKDKKVVSANGTSNELKATLQSLMAHTTYRIRAYAVNKNGVTYSNEVAVTTKKKDPEIDDPAFPKN